MGGSRATSGIAPSESVDRDPAGGKTDAAMCASPAGGPTTGVVAKTGSSPAGRARAVAGLVSTAPVPADITDAVGEVAGDAAGTTSTRRSDADELTPAGSEGLAVAVFVGDPLATGGDIGTPAPAGLEDLVMLVLVGVLCFA